MDSQLLHLSHRIDLLRMLLLSHIIAILILAVLGAVVVVRLIRKCEYKGEIVLKSRSGQANLTLGVDDGGCPNIRFWGDSRRLRFSIGMLEEDSGGTLAVCDEVGRIRIILGNSPESGPYLGFADEGGEVGLRLGISPEDQVRIFAGNGGSGEHDLLARVESLERANRAYLGAYQKALGYWSRAKGADSEEVAGFLLRLGSIKSDLGEHDEAESLYGRAFAIWEKTKGLESEEAAGCLVNLGLVAQARGKSEEAETRFRQALAIREKRFGPDHSEVAESLSLLVSLLHKREEFAECEPLQRRVLKIWGEILGADHPDVVAQREYHAALLRLLDRVEEAEAVASGLASKRTRSHTPGG